MMASNVTDLESYFRFMKKLKHRPLFCIGHCAIEESKRIGFLETLFDTREFNYKYLYEDMHVRISQFSILRYHQFFKWAPEKLQEKFMEVNACSYLNPKTPLEKAKLLDATICDLVPRVDSLKILASNYVKKNLENLASTRIQTWNHFKTLVADGSESPLLLKSWDDYKWAYIAYASWPKEKRYQMLGEHLQEFVGYEDEETGEYITGYFTLENGGKFAEISKLDDYFFQKASFLKSGVGKLVDGKIQLPPGFKIKAKNR